MDFDLVAHTHLLVVAGSRAYGMHTAASDVDVKGVAIPPLAYFLGYLHRFDQADKPGHIAAFTPFLSDAERAIVSESKLEGTVFNLVKFVALAADSNPNILDVIFCRDAEVRYSTPIGDTLRSHRDVFVSARAKHTFSGYAASQLKRVRGHRAWLLNPPKGKPTRADFGLPEHTLIPSDHLAALRAAVQKQLDLWEPNLASLSMSDRVAVQTGISEYLEQFCAALPEGLVDEADRVEGARYLAAARHIGVSDNLIWVLQREREYEAAMRGYRQYEEWRRSRNADRAALEAKYGYDTKHGAHLVRLLRMGREILETGRVNVWRGADGGSGDADELRAIRAGAWDYDRIVEYASSLDAELTATYNRGDYVVPKSPDRNAIDRLCVDLVDTALRGAA
jgi:predicted nucleotidyltransferase